MKKLMIIIIVVLSTNLHAQITSQTIKKNRVELLKKVPNLPQVLPPSLDESLLQRKYGGYEPSYKQMDTRGISSPNVFIPPTTNVGKYSNQEDPNAFFDWLKTPSPTEFRPKTFTLDEFDTAQSGRYKNYLPGYNINGKK